MSDTIPVFIVTDEDGDNLTVETLDGDGRFVATISGEDGHRAIILTHNQASALVAALRAALL
jgi:hypothetical protein